MLNIEGLIEKSKLHIVNWILCSIAGLEILMFLDMTRVFNYDAAIRLSLLPAYFMFLFSDLSLMIINGQRIKAIRDGKFAVYKEYSFGSSFWVFVDDICTIAKIPGDIQLDDFLKSKIIN